MYENYSILIVDDEANILNALRRALLDEEFTCYFAESAYQAYDYLETKKIHVIVTDMRMPNVNGLDLLKQINIKYPTMIKLVLSGYTQLSQILATINQVNIFNFILKPWNNEELILILHKALDYFILQEENSKYKLLLEIKNQSYQNILKRIEDVIDHAKKSAEMLRSISNEILTFGRDFRPEEYILYYPIFTKQYEIYQILSNAVTTEQSTMSTFQLQQRLTNHILKYFPETIVDTKPVTEQSITLNQQMLEAFLASTIVLFHDEFSQHGLYLSFLHSNKFVLSLLSKNAADHTSQSNIPTVFDTKVAYLHSIYDKIRDMCQITLQIINKDGNLVIGFSLEEL